MSSYYKLKFSEIKSQLNEGKLSSEQLVQSYLERIRNFDSKIQAFIQWKESSLLEQARESDQRRKSGKQLSEWDGIPIAIKDNICIEGETSSCASKILENYKSPFSATSIEKLKSKGFLFFPRTNMDEFAMGSSTENSAFQITKNPFDTKRIPGGSSGGSAAAVSAGMTSIALGSDTGGSVRQPASLCGIYGLKPTYGRISRFGLIAYASSLDQIGPMGNDLESIVDIFSIISGKDSKDATTLQEGNFSYNPSKDFSMKNKSIGIMNEGLDSWDPDIKSNYLNLLDQLKNDGANLVPLDFSILKYSIPIYYIIATAECSSNLARFDGIRYGHRANSQKLEDLYIDSRTEGFGKEVKRRILLGTFSLSTGYYDAYYGQAKKAQALLRKQYLDYFKKVEIILHPTSPITAFHVGEKSEDPVQMYMADLFTTSVNLTGLPGLNIPSGLSSKNLPIGMQITAPHNREDLIFDYANYLKQYCQINLPENIL
jgi:aspartyl-tRNA(Asn)/glutamyl-tRNA(Gln) amidotransferase subunit A